MPCTSCFTLENKQHTSWLLLDLSGQEWERTSLHGLEHVSHARSTNTCLYFQDPDSRLNQIHIGIVGSSHGQLYLLTCIDHFSCWPEAFLMPDMTADTVALIFTPVWIACSGVPSTITTDCGWKHLCTTAYHPAANGMIECFHQQLKPALKAQPSNQHWIKNLPLAPLGIRTVWQPSRPTGSAVLLS